MIKKLVESKPVDAFTTVNWCKILKGSLFAGMGAIGAYLLQESQTIDFGKYQVIAATVLSILANVLHKWQSELGKED